ncbi:TetR/AcrR family transcriptional regulator [Aetokthonos hydrillicola Thurmond2011]|jgi:AcrR family transcriptional regulator|uniref:TetR/AcrR family transcriptional regulator n=1 Tax=Aetokthonos hydrillicola Thurmond2011 TaxID=2712845 RepID=A0AAP5I4A0_9CYAN|nr:TetR/AcrR family transcriptional regulator [Aetokthonos hydrillicola]MBO3457533.1 TetR/AcrR family transcriptional regulator [Aetokthonos hydrillicola CCALA 1050]MBW4590743.1 TetR/AcrR family transcriptional regulator [Aetokthonos hydrillicola CCALA 1050]MDR9894787.1 TetR/AcrR family transcriptional regulator [Aetokthonos hydrillicola Thurmond2011]
MTTQNLRGESSTKILETACRLFYEQGYHVTGINQLIAEAGVAKASFYHHFSSKEELCVAYLNKRHLDWFSWLQEEVEKNQDHQERLLSLFTFLERWLSNSNYRGCAFINIASEFPLPESKIRLAVIEHKNALRDYIRDLVSKLDIEDKKHNTVFLVDAIYVLFEGAITSSQLYCSVQSIHAAREAVRQLIS